MKKNIYLTFFVCLWSMIAFCHNIELSSFKLREWTLNDNTKVKASFLMIKNDLVYLEKENSTTINLPLSALSTIDQQYVHGEYERIQKLNTQKISSVKNDAVSYSNIDYKKMTVVAPCLLLLLILTYFFAGKKRLKYGTYFSITVLLAVLYSFKTVSENRVTTVTDPATVNLAFIPFFPNVATSWDATYFYIQSKGIPTTHPMMIGITSWQQQVPIPQCYTGTNAWSIPLNPVIAAIPVPVSPAHFSRGAIAIAANGIPIFNPYTNTGVDAFLDGQLDNWGGHCGRADDYHYHTAPLHLYGTTSSTLPIAFGLDGFAVYGSVEPNGTPMLALDANHGHYGSNGVYHYHGTATAPYMIGNMVGQVTEDATNQIIPQAAAHPIRPSLTPLNGAVITNCVANGTNGYILTYTRTGQTYQVSYSWTNNGVYTFNFINPGSTTTNIYNGFAQCSITITLPLTLTSFTVTALGNTARIKWTTANEINLSHFIIERSVGGGNWEAIKQVAATNTNNNHEYSILDNTPVKGANYYRLKSVDRDTKTTYSKIQFINIGNQGNTEIIFENASGNQVFFQCNTELYQYRFINGAGQPVLSGNIKGSSTISISNLPGGMYIVELRNASTNYIVTKKIIKGMN